MSESVVQYTSAQIEVAKKTSADIAEVLKSGELTAIQQARLRSRSRLVALAGLISGNIVATGEDVSTAVDLFKEGAEGKKVTSLAYPNDKRRGLSMIEIGLVYQLRETLDDVDKDPVSVALEDLAQHVANSDTVLSGDFTDDFDTALHQIRGTTISLPRTNTRAAQLHMLEPANQVSSALVSSIVDAGKALDLVDSDRLEPDEFGDAYPEFQDNV